jgi:hypothetical protein
MKFQLAEGLAMFGSIALKVFGQTAPALDPGLVGLIGNLGIVGVLIWHLYHTTQSHPKMLERFSVEADRMRAESAREQQEARAAFAREQAESRASFLGEQKAQRDFFNKEMAEMRTMLISTLTAMRSAVHEVKDTANTAINQKALALAQTMVAGDPGKPG